MKKLFCLAMTIILALALAAPAFAVQEGELTGGSITINNAVKDETYRLYQILYLESYNAEAGTYAYKANSEWADWLATQTDFVKIENGYVSWVGEADPAAFAKAALQHAGETIQPVSTVKADSNVVNFSDLKLGYYLIDTSLGSLCSLDTTNSTVEIYEKNSVPSVTKQVWEDNGESYKNDATIDVTDTVKYQLTVNTGTNTHGNGATGVDSNYVITDVLPAGITYNEGSVAISDSTGAWALTDDYTVAYENQTLTINLLSTGKLARMGQSANITITYNANVTGEVQIGHTAGNVNNVTLKYHEQESKASATVYTYSIGGEGSGSPIKKVDGTEGPNKNQPLAGVKFVLQNNTTKKFATFAEDGKLTGWKDSKAEATALETDADGAIYAYGLDADTYILTETETLPGYNLLADTITAVIDDEGNVTYKYTKTAGDGSSSIIIENKAGTELPSTGGMGTTIFYTLGGVLVVGAAVLLVTKKRMSNAQ